MTDVNVLVGSPESFFVDDANVVCEACGGAVYIRPYNKPKAGDKIRVLCIACARGAIKPDTPIHFNKNVEEELLRLGISKDEIERMRGRIVKDLRRGEGKL